MRYTPVLLNKKRICEGSYACTDTVSKDGKIYLAPNGNPHNIALYSENRGADFQVLRPTENAFRERFIELDDGSFLALGFNNVAFDAVFDKEQENIPFVMSVYTADSVEAVRDGKIKTRFVNVDIPGLSSGYGDSANRSAGSVSGGLIQLSNGDIFATMYGQFAEDKTLCPYFEENGNYKFYLYRTWCIISHDRGRTFEYVSTVADVQTYPIADINAEGYCEADVIEIEPGHIVSVLRTGGHEVYSPLYCSHSYDFGRTWEKPYEICDWGVLPRLITMHDGTLVCCSGHIHTMLLFSDDKGKTWSEPFIVEECDGKWDKSPSGYNSVFESRPGELTIVYDDPKEGISEGAEPGMLRNIYIARYRINKENEA